MTNLSAWLRTRPSSPPSKPAPARRENVVASALSRDGYADVRVIRRADGNFTYQIVAWTNFEDAGGNPHCQWHSFDPSSGMIAATFKVAADEALREARAYGIDIDESTLRSNTPLNRAHEE